MAELSQIRMSLDSSGVVSGARAASQAIDGVTESMNNQALAEIRAEQAAERNANRNMPGFNGNGAINGNNNNSLNQFSGSRETAQEIARLKATIENLNRNIEKANSEIAKSNESGDARGTFNWTSSLNQMEEAKQRAENRLKQLEASEKDKGIEALVNDRKAQMYSQAWNYAIQGANIYNGYRTSMANGDYLGAGANAKDQIGGAAMNIGGTLMSAGGMMAATGMGTIPGAIVGGIGVIAMGAGGILKLLAGDEQADNAEAKAYENSLPYLHAFNRRYKDTGDYRDTDALRQRAVELSRDTGLSTYDFLNTALQQTTFGLSQEAALSRTKMAAMWANATGADIGTIQEVLGLSSRMGKETDTAFLARAREASGLGKAQTGEFLQGLQTVIEEGISNGYNKSTEDAAKNFAMFSSLSGNSPLWEGKYAAQKINTMSNTIAGAVNLSDINQVMTIDTARRIAGGMEDKKFNSLMGFGKTGTYLDAMLIAENGLTPEMFRGLGKTINDLEGSNLTARVERWRSMSGLNYKGAVELDRMYRSNPNMDDNAIKAKIDSMKADPTYQSEETKKIEVINRIDSSVQKIGQSKFWDNYEKLLGVEREQGIKVTRKAESDSNDIAELQGSKGYGNRYTDKVATLHGLNQFETYRKLRYDTYGNEELDAKTTEMFEDFAAYGEKFGHKADGKATVEEFSNFIRYMEGKKGEAARAAYASGDMALYMAELKKLLTELFGNLTIVSNSY